MVAVLMEGMLPMSLSDIAHQHQLARVHVRIGVVRLVRIIRRVVGIHVVRHGAPVDHEIIRMVRLGHHVERGRAVELAAGRARGDLLQLIRYLLMNLRIHLGPLHQVLAVVAGRGVIVGGRRLPVINPTRFHQPCSCREDSSGVTITAPNRPISICKSG